MDGVSAPAAGLLGASPATSLNAANRNAARFATSAGETFAALLGQSETAPAQAAPRAGARGASQPSNAADNAQPEKQAEDAKKKGEDTDLVGLSVVQAVLNAPAKNSASPSSPVSASAAQAARTQAGDPSAFPAPPGQSPSSPSARAPDAAAAMLGADEASDAATDSIDTLYERIFAGARASQDSTSPAFKQSTSAVPLSQALLLLQGKPAPSAGAATLTSETQTPTNANPSQAANANAAAAVQNTGETAAAGAQAQTQIQAQMQPQDLSGSRLTRAEQRREGRGANMASPSLDTAASTPAVNASPASSAKPAAAPVVSDALAAQTHAQGVKPLETSPSDGAPKIPDAEALNADFSDLIEAEGGGEARETSSSARTHGANAAPAHLRSASQVAAQAWSSVIQRFDGRAQRFEIRLDPAELGEIDVSIEITKDNKAKIVMAVRTSEAMNDLSRSARALETALAESGVDLQEDGLSFEFSSNDSSSFTFSGDNNPNEDAKPSLPAQNAAEPPPEDVSEERTVTPRMSIWTRPGVNLKA